MSTSRTLYMRAGVPTVFWSGQRFHLSPHDMGPRIDWSALIGVKVDVLTTVLDDVVLVAVPGGVEHPYSFDAGDPVYLEAEKAEKSLEGVGIGLVVYVLGELISEGGWLTRYVGADLSDVMEHARSLADLGEAPASVWREFMVMSVRCWNSDNGRWHIEEHEVTL